MLIGRLDEARVRNIARTLIDEKPRKYREILKNYQRLIRLELTKHHALIESAADLDAETRRQLLGTLRAKYGDELTTEFKTSPDLIGGLRIKIGSDVWDSSVRGRLARLESSSPLPDRLKLSTLNHSLTDEQHPPGTRNANQLASRPARPNRTSASSAKSATASPRSKV